MKIKELNYILNLFEHDIELGIQTPDGKHYDLDPERITLIMKHRPDDSCLCQNKIILQIVEARDGRNNV